MKILKLLLYVFVLIHLGSLSSAVQSAEKVEDEETGLTFQYPSSASPMQIVHTDLWMISTQGVPTTSKLIQWNVFNTDYFEGTLKERCTKFGENQAGSDGPEGGTKSAVSYLATVKSKSGDEVLIFELEIIGFGSAENVNGRPAGFMLGVDLKPTDKKKYRHLFIHSASKKIIMDIAKSIEIPRNVSLKK